MCKQSLILAGFIASTLATPSLGTEAEFGSTQEAQAMLVRAVDALKEDKADAIARFNHNDARFRDRDLFVFCFNRQDRKFTAHEAMVGRDARDFRDQTGKDFYIEMQQVAREGKISQVAFLSALPGSTEKATRLAYVTVVSDQICGVSAYRFGPSAQSQ